MKPAVGEMASSTASCPETPGMPIDLDIVMMKGTHDLWAQTQIHDEPLKLSLRFENVSCQVLSCCQLRNK